MLLLNRKPNTKLARNSLSVEAPFPLVCWREGAATRRLARKGVSNTLGLVDFAARLVNSVLNLSDG